MARGTVFVIDDDPHMRRLAMLMLASGEFHLRPYASAEAFLRDLPEALPSDGQPCCALLDIQMPGMNGLDLQRRLQRENTPIPTVILTGHAAVSLAVRALQDGAFHFLEKPIRNDVLQHCVENALEHAERVRAASRVRERINERIATLSAREREVLDLLLEAKNIKEIAAAMGIGVQTVAKHHAKVLRKLEVRNDVDLALLIGSVRGTCSIEDLADLAKQDVDAKRLLQ
ncbi:MAG: response regulator [Planctomycetales bacterium]